MAEITLIIAFFAGLVSFISPCILPLIPAFLSYLSGISISEVNKSFKGRMVVFVNTIFFIIGFSVVFSILGILINSIFSDVAYDFRIWLGRIGGIIIIIFGLFLVKLIRLPFLEREHKLKLKKFKFSYLTSFVFGIAFAAGWTPCIGAVLGSILTLAAVSAKNAFYLLMSYSLGLSIPFLLTGLFVSRMQNIIKRFEKPLGYFNLVVGILLIMLGILVFTNTLSNIADFAILQKVFSRG